MDDAPLAQIDAGSPEVLTYLHTDHLGTPRFGTNTGGTQVWAWASDAFGVGAPSGAAMVNLRMPGQYFDSESNLFYNWNRYYNPAIGRYISSDPIGLEGGLNTFLYAEASPAMYSDPEGLAVFDDKVCVLEGKCTPIFGGGKGGSIGPVLGASTVAIGAMCSQSVDGALLLLICGTLQELIYQADIRYGIWGCDRCPLALH